MNPIEPTQPDLNKSEWNNPISELVDLETFRQHVEQILMQQLNMTGAPIEGIESSQGIITINPGYLLHLSVTAAQMEVENIIARIALPESIILLNNAPLHQVNLVFTQKIDHQPEFTEIEFTINPD